MVGVGPEPIGYQLHPATNTALCLDVYYGGTGDGGAESAAAWLAILTPSVIRVT